jgi:peptide/nickel transport system substrate-binding protein
VFDLAAPNPDFAYGLTEVMIISGAAIKAHAQSWFTTHADGTGPYEVQTYSPGGSKYVLTAFPGYWGGWSGPHFTRLVFELVESDASQLILLKNGSVDYAENIPVTDLASLKADSQVKIVVTHVPAPFYIGMNTLRGPLANLKVREAISDAFDYVAAAKGAMMGYASSMHGPVPPMLPNADPSLPAGRQNLALAKKLLAEAGYPHGGFTLTFLYLEHWLFEETIGLILQQDLAKLGIKLQLQGQPWATITARIASRTNAPDMVIYEDEVPTPSVYQLLQPMYQSSSAFWAHFQFSNQQVDKLLTQYGDTFSEGARRSIALKLQKLIYSLHPQIWVFNQDDLRTFRSDIAGYSYQPAYASILNYYGMHRT